MSEQIQPPHVPDPTPRQTPETADRSTREPLAGEAVGNVIPIADDILVPQVRTTLVVGGKDYPVPPGRDLDELKTQLVDAVRVGGDFVELGTPGSPDLSVLITPDVPVRIEQHAVAVSSPDEQRSSSGEYAFDEYDLPN